MEAFVILTVTPKDVAEGRLISASPPPSRPRLIPRVYGLYWTSTAT
jgi:hypothetical protein